VGDQQQWQRERIEEANFMDRSYDSDLNAAIKALEADGRLGDEIGGRLSANLQ